MALREKMAVSAHSIKPDLAAAPSPTRTLETAPSREACISARLWVSSGNPDHEIFLWESENPAANLILDLIAASGGLPVARQGEILVASFTSFQLAILAARRLQWAMQGFSEAGNPQAVSLALLIHSSEDASGPTIGEVAQTLSQAAPGQILLMEKAALPFESLPGFPMLAVSVKGLRELQWRCPESHSTRSHDEEMLAQFIEQEALLNQAEELPQLAAPPVEDLAPAEGIGYQRQLLSEQPGGNSRWMVGGLVVAVLAVVVMAILYFHGKPNPAPDQEQAQTAPAASTTAPDAQSGPSSAVGATHPAVLTRAEKQAAAKAAKNADKGEVKPPVAAPAPVKNEEKPPPPKAVEAPPARGGRCDLEPSEYAGQVDQAWKNLGRGRYADAQREFGAVLACDPGNARAKEGLERARLAASEAAGG